METPGRGVLAASTRPVMVQEEAAGAGRSAATGAGAAWPQRSGPASSRAAARQGRIGRFALPFASTAWFTLSMVAVNLIRKVGCATGQASTVPVQIPQRLKPVSKLPASNRRAKALRHPVEHEAFDHPHLRSADVGHRTRAQVLFPTGLI